MPSKKTKHSECTFEIEQAILEHNTNRVAYVKNLLDSLATIQERTEREYKIDSVIHDRLVNLSEKVVTILESELEKL
jgi:predicted nucleotide-binding protein